MLTPDHVNILRTAFNRAGGNGTHSTIQPPPQSLASEIVDLFSCSTLNNKMQRSKKIKDSYMRILPNHIHTAMQKGALVTQEKWPLPWTTTPATSTTGVNTLEIGYLERSTTALFQILRIFNMPSNLR